jgi:hypothetical protein
MIHMECYQIITHLNLKIKQYLNLNTGLNRLYQENYLIKYNYLCN